MKKYFKLCVALVLVAIMIVSPINFVQAEESILDEQQTLVRAKFLAEIKKYSPDPPAYNIVATKQLKSIATDEYLYTLCELSPSGYAVFLNETGSLLEANYDTGVITSNSVSDAKVDLYYVGPYSFALKQGNIFKNLKDQTVISEETIEKIELTENAMLNYEIVNASNMQQRGPVLPLVDRLYEVGTSYFPNLTCTIMNVDGTCTTIAATILLHYYDDNISDNFIATSYESTTTSTGGKATNSSFYNLLCDYIYGNSPLSGRSISQISSGVNNYLNTRSVSYDYSYIETVYESQLYTVHNQIVSKIKSGRPVIAATQSALMDDATSSEYDDFHDHSMVVYGCSYSETSGSSSTDTRNFRDLKFRVYSENSIKSAWVSAGWFNACGYLY